MKYIRCFFCLFIFLPVTVFAQQTLSFASYDTPPYVSPRLDQYGALTKIVKTVFDSIGQPTQVVFVPASRSAPLAIAGHFDGVFPLVANESNEDDFYVTLPLTTIDIGLLYRKRANDDVPAISSKTRIAAVAGSFSDDVLTSYQLSQFEYVDRSEQALKMLYTGRVDYVLMDKFRASNLMVDRFPYMINQFVFRDDINHSISLNVGFPKTNPEAFDLRDLFNKQLTQLNKNKTIEQILYDEGLRLLPYRQEQQEERTLVRIAVVDSVPFRMLAELSPQYEAAHPEVKLEWHFLDESILRRRLLSDIALSSGQFDIAAIGPYEGPLWAERGWLAKLDKLPKDYDIDDLLAVMKQGLSLAGELYALPLVGETSITYYRTDLFENRGYQMPERPTWDDIEMYASALHDPDNGRYGVCMRGKTGWGENITVIGIMVNSFGGRWFDMNWKPQINSKPWQTAIGRYVQLIKNYGPEDAYLLGYEGTKKLFSDGKCAIWVDASVAAPDVYNPKLSTVADKVGVVHAPIGTTPKGSAWMWTWALGVSTAAQAKQQAEQFIVWATSKQYVETVAQHYGWKNVPTGARESTYKNSEYISQAPFANLVYSALKDVSLTDATVQPVPYLGVQFVAIPEFTAFGYEVSRQINLVLQGQKSVDQALNQAQIFTENVMRYSRSEIGN